MPPRWWDDDPSERYWLEVTNRPDIGGALNAPATSRTSHLLVGEIRVGDVVFHYDKRRHGIVGWSYAVGKPTEEDGTLWAEIDWGGDAWVSLDRLRMFDPTIRAVSNNIRASVTDRRGLPFETGARAIRPLPAYLAKMPVAMVTAIPELAAAVGLTVTAPPQRRGSYPTAAGQKYREADEGIVIPFIRTPETAAWRTEAGTRAHRALQNALARFLRYHGIPVLSPIGSDVQFDIAWQVGGRLAFAEVKSLPRGSESQRLRLALGQCLIYRYALEKARGEAVAPYIVVPREPSDSLWPPTCRDVGVSLIWPDLFEELLAAA